jgi:hypothetical protein
MLSDRYKRTGNADDLDMAILKAEEAVALTPVVYDAPWYQPPKLLILAIAHPAPKTRACNANQMPILSSCSLA